jgi:hypothetical protein
VWVEQSGKIVYVISRNGFDMDEGRLILSLREARILREELICLSYATELEGETDEDG